MTAAADDLAVDNLTITTDDRCSGWPFQWITVAVDGRRSR